MPHLCMDPPPTQNPYDKQPSETGMDTWSKLQAMQRDTHTSVPWLRVHPNCTDQVDHGARKTGFARFLLRTHKSLVEMDAPVLWQETETHFWRALALFLVECLEGTKSEDFLAQITGRERVNPHDPEWHQTVSGSKERTSTRAFDTLLNKQPCLSGSSYEVLLGIQTANFAPYPCVAKATQ
jgi:hypothetical protein